MSFCKENVYKTICPSLELIFMVKLISVSGVCGSCISIFVIQFPIFPRIVGFETQASCNMLLILLLTLLSPIQLMRVLFIFLPFIMFIRPESVYSAPCELRVLISFLLEFETFFSAGKGEFVFI